MKKPPPIKAGAFVLVLAHDPIHCHFSNNVIHGREVVLFVEPAGIVFLVHIHEDFVGREYGFQEFVFVIREPFERFNSLFLVVGPYENLSCVNVVVDDSDIADFVGHLKYFLSLCGVISS